MAFVYHLCSPDFEGDVLYSLEGLRSRLPHVYERERQKYTGREGMLEFKVPYLNVTWTETVNLSGLDPRLLIQERKRLGVPLSKLQSRSLVAIPIERLSPSKCIQYISSAHWINSLPGDPNAPLLPPETDFFKFEIDSYTEPVSVPHAHTEYLRERHEKGEVPLGFVFIPHVLVAHEVDISGLERISLSG